MRRLHVEAKDDLLRSFVGKPVGGIVELIYNALDADADEVTVSVEENEAGGIEAVVVEDTGSGMTPMAGESGFTGLGGSWKAAAAGVTPKGRHLHGSLGRGRYAAYSIGERVTWESVAEEGGKRTRIRLSGSRSDLTNFEISEPEETDAPTGTRVRISLPTEAAQTALLNDKVAEMLTATFALYLTRFKQVSIKWRGKALNPSKYFSREPAEYRLDVVEGQTISLTVIEWTFKRVERRIFLCDGNGMTVSEAPARIHAPDYQFTAYLNWDRFREMGHDLLLHEFENSEAFPVIEAAKERLKQHFKQRDRERQRKIIEKWQEEDVYPYPDKPRSEADEVARETFDLVALAAARVVNENRSAKGKRFALRLIKEAIDHSPSALKTLLQEVIGLSEQQLEDFEALREHTSLSNMLQANTIVADRLDFLNLLETIIHEHEPKHRTLERSLHRLLEAEPWVFGNEWSVATSDQRLTAALIEHMKHLDPGSEVETTAIEPVALVDGNTMARPDLLLWRAARNLRNRYEYLVVELKRPRIPITEEHLSQIKKYALAVVNDTRFNMLDVQWDFWLIGDELSEFIVNEREQKNLPPGAVFQHPKYTIYVKQWSEVLADAEQRLKFVKENLQYDPDRDSSIERMRRKHAELLADVFPQDEAASPTPETGAESQLGNLVDQETRQ
ncbi:hypothetical protein GXB85_05420 [Cellulomonas sp. APG4]|uniref:ATP-binding protein n=1 Tax=Cellulomonas sp. APG4 TaxID=1538656 RepID=UPI00137ADAB3|nr:ATP-binding protein [Cellulomonas sp. APG4]NCT90391.1 hypothetical protein [Cellulomonas sp. APG4]